MCCESVQDQAIQPTTPRKIKSHLPAMKEESFYQEIIFYINKCNTKLFVSVVPVPSVVCVIYSVGNS